MLRVQVSGDGAGGAGDVRGSGLRGLEDRVAVVRGSFRAGNLPDGGTHVAAGLPCHG
jgi:signal transduction histidine kinase